MTINLPIDTMSISEKLQVIELVWDSIRRNPDDAPSPDWHAELLAVCEQMGHVRTNGSGLFVCIA